MKKLIIVFMVVCISSCTKIDDFIQIYGTKLVSLEYTDEYNTWVESFSYSQNGRLKTVENHNSRDRRYELEYQNERLKEYSTYSSWDDKLIFRDSILYNTNGAIESIYHYSINSGKDLPLSIVYEFEYDDEKRVSKKKTFFVSSQKYTTIEKFYWNEENIERVEYYNGEEKLFYEYFYKYDDKINYKKDHPISIFDPIYWSNNNVIEVNWRDYLGNLELNCRPCTSRYWYNLDDYPIRIKFSNGGKIKLNYE